MNYCALVLVLAFMLISGCDQALLGPDPENTPEGNFEMLWKEFDQWYSLFEVKGIDWDSVYRVYRPQITATTTEYELWQITTNMLELLDDHHVGVRSPNGRQFQSGMRNDTGRAVSAWGVGISQNIALNFSDGRIPYGRLSDSIGYIGIFSFDGEVKTDADPWASEIDGIITALQDTRGIIIDVRGNGGGNPFNARRIAGAFADRERPFAIVRTKNGPGHHDFSAPTTLSIHPEGNTQYTKPVIIITDRESVSAAEQFVLALRRFPNVRQVGDTTAGAMSRLSFERQLPNGWLYWMSIQLLTDTEGLTHEGQGLPPDVLVVNTVEDIVNGNDRMLEKAVEMLR